MADAMATPCGPPAAGARNPFPDFAESISRAITRPCGPEPCTRPRSMPASFARVRANGDEKTRLLEEVRSPSPADFGGDLSPLGRGEGRRACGATETAPSPRWGEGWGEGGNAFRFFSGVLTGAV